MLLNPLQRYGIDNISRYNRACFFIGMFHKRKRDILLRYYAMEFG